MIVECLAWEDVTQNYNTLNLLHSRGAAAAAATLSSGRVMWLQGSFLIITFPADNNNIGGLVSRFCGR